jgi:adenosylcobinamide-phosphate synthase
VSGSQSLTPIEGVAATEAKVGALVEAGIRTAEGGQATGTVTDAGGDRVDRARPARAVHRPGNRGRMVPRARLAAGRPRRYPTAMRLRRPAVLLLAVTLDLALGEPAARWHPVAWLGRALGWAERRAPGRSIADGAVAVALVVGTAWAGARALASVTGRLGWMGVVLEALALKPAFALRRLDEATDGVEAALRAGDLESARMLVGRDLVSRPTHDLGADEVASAAIESAAENLVDSIAAPVLAYAARGLPAAWAYRAVNTADAMWGYRDERYERFGKAAARLDDLANLVPARLGALALMAGAALAGESGWDAARVAWAQHRRTTSPNAGWPIAALAGALGVGLAKRGTHRLGEHALPASPDAVRRARRVLAAGAAVTVLAVTGVALAGGGRR